MYRTPELCLNRGRGLLCLLAVLVGSFNAACSTTIPQLPAPESRMPAAFASPPIIQQLQAEGLEQGVATVRWWEGFSDPILNQLVQKSLENNFEIAAAAARVNEARALLALDRAGNSPLLELQGELRSQHSNRNNLTGNSTGSANSQRMEKQVLSGFGASLPLDIAGRNEQRVRAAEAGLLIQQAQLRAQIMATSSAVAQEYLSLRGNQKQLLLLQESVGLQEKTLALVKARFESGLSPELDVRRAETSVETLRANIAPLQQALQNSRNRLAVLSGAFPGAYESLLSTAGVLNIYTLRIPAMLPVQVIQARPDVQLAQARFARAAADVGLAEANFYPNLELMASLQIGRGMVNSNPASSILVNALSAVLEQTIFDGGARSARLDAAHARARAELANYEQVLRQVVEEVEQALFAVNTSAQRQEALNKAVLSSRRSFQQADALYQLGLVSFLDVVDAQRVYANAEQSLAAEQTNHATRVAGLFRVLGVGPS